MLYIILLFKEVLLDMNICIGVHESFHKKARIAGQVQSSYRRSISLLHLSQQLGIEQGSLKAFTLPLSSGGFIEYAFFS